MPLQLDPSVPLVWRTPTSLQLGIDEPRVVLDDVTAGVERMLTALRGGISESGWHMLARGAGLDADDADELLGRLAPLLVPAQPAAPASIALVLGDGDIARELAAFLRESGRLADPQQPDPHLVVLVADWILGPDDAQPWLRRDIPHVPVIATDRAVTVGPFVEPGAGPCVYCAQLGRTDADPAWPAIAAQLWGRPAPRLSRLTVSSAAAFVARRVLRRLDGGPDAAASIGRVWRLLGEGGTVSASTVLRHPRCSCAAPPESDWAPGSGLAVPAATSSG
jgi:bacteriocin biosynthesis cyclodehydratase domain-containing protein